MKIPYQTPVNATIIACLFLTFMFLAPAHAQFFRHGEHHFPELHPDSVVRLNHNISKMEYEPGELLVRFQDELELSVSKHNGIAQTGISAVDQLLQTHSVTEVNKLIPGAQRLTEKEWLTAPNGTQFERPSLHNIYLLKVEDEGYQLFDLIQALNDEPSVMYAEPNYIYRLVDYSIDSPVLSAEDLQQMRTNNKSTAKEGIEPDDPMFNQQWWIGAIGADVAWEQSTGDDDQVIAILDTGVDWQHPDLQNKIWSNPNEIANGQDSDGNGFVDDIRGWDFINNNNNPMDDNSHGTHVAGIAAAEADNGIGIAGVSWGARIMPVKVLQSSGAGTAAVITQGINYAANNGATVINMSLGSYALSLAMQDALANAYATAVLVAAAGNDGICIGPGMFCAPMFPAAFSFVLGVEASNSSGLRTLFSNYDQDGPVYSAYPELYNYELLAPGTQLISTIPGGSYRIYSGTSMAAPVIAGSASIYQSLYPCRSQEIMWADMIHSSDGVINLPASLEGILDAKLALVSHEMLDTLGGDGDGFPDAGETIEIWYTLRNTGAQADNVNIGLRFGEFEDTTTANILNDHAYIGSMSSYATQTNESNPFVIQIDSNVVNDRHIVFEAYSYNEGETDTIFQPLILTIQNGTKLMGVMDSTLVLTSDRLWLVNHSFKIGPNGTLIINPGTTLILNEPIINDGSILSQGIEGNQVYINGANGANGIRGSGTIHATETSLLNMSSPTGSNSSVFYFSSATFENSYFYNISTHALLAGWSSSNVSFSIINSRIKNITLTHSLTGWGSNLSVTRSTFDNIVFHATQPGTGADAEKSNFNRMVGLQYESCFLTNQQNATIINNNFLTISKGYMVRAKYGYIDSIPHNYWGSLNSTIIEEKIFDFWNDPHWAEMIYEPKLEQPNPDTHGIVWKVLVNGADAQDEYVEPVGVGPHKFEVYFNRPMDIEYPPNVTFGVRYPYTQQAVADSAFWSADSTVYTAWKTVQLFTGDGINRIRVSGARDPEGFEIPIEDMRFEFLIDAAGAASTNFMATPGMGRIDLTWDEPDELDDLLGYNMYRFEHVTDTTFTDPILLNTQLILDPELTDFDVIPGDKYYYYYKILRTNMAESDSSRVVMGIPDTAAPGDANGDYNVDVMDIVAIVAYMLNQNPQPFIFEAADVNQDGVINVMDIVGVVDLIMNDKSAFFPNPRMHPDPAYVHFKDDIVQIESDGQLAALQFELHTAWPELISLTSLLPGFELAWQKTENGIEGFIFNMQNKTIQAGITDIIKINHTNPDLHWHSIFGSDPDGQYVEVLTTPVGIDEDISLPMEFAMALFPNPANTQFTINYFLPVRSDVHIEIYDLFGRKLHTISQSRQAAGEHFVTKNTARLGTSQGLVLVRMTATGRDGNNFSKTVKLMLH